MSRYQRQLNLPGFGPEGQQALMQGSVLVVGAGGLGVPVLQYLCSMGVGRIGIVDGDRIQLTNLQRQVLYDTPDVGLLKAEVAGDKLRRQNPDVQIDVHALMLTPANAIALIREYDLIVDATDVFAARYLINDACVMLEKSWVFGAVHQFEGQVSVFNYRNGPTYRCLFPKQPGPGEIPDCTLGGVLGVAPGIVGMRLALEAVKVLSAIGAPLSGVVLMIDLLRDTEYRMRLKPIAENKRIDRLGEYGAACSAAMEIQPSELRSFLETAQPLIWDVRSSGEFSAVHLPDAVSVPLESVAGIAPGLAVERPLLLYCQRGVRSREAAAQLLTRRGDLIVYTLAGGLDACSPDLYSK